MSDIEEMSTEPLHMGILGLVYILFVTGIACDAVDYVGSFKLMYLPGYYLPITLHMNQLFF